MLVPNLNVMEASLTSYLQIAIGIKLVNWMAWPLPHPAIRQLVWCILLAMLCLLAIPCLCQMVAPRVLIFQAVMPVCCISLSKDFHC